MALLSYFLYFNMLWHLPKEALIIDLLILRVIVQQTQYRDDTQRPEDETDYAVKPTNTHVLGKVVFFQAIS